MREEDRRGDISNCPRFCTVLVLCTAFVHKEVLVDTVVCAPITCT